MSTEPTLSKSLRLAVSGFAIAALLGVGGLAVATGNWHSAAWAADDGDSDGSGGPDNAQGHQGGQGQGSKGAQSGQDNQGGQGAGQGGPDPDSDSKGPHAGSPADTGSSGGKPVWAQEGIPEVELGRLSVARSPDQVLDRALAEALATVSGDLVAFYNQSLDDMIYDLSVNWDAISIYDSPLQNLALMKDALDGTSALKDEGVMTDNDTLLAVFLGVASDKNVAVSTDTVIAVTTILGTPIEGTEAEAIAEDAEAIRIAVLAGHG